MYHVSIIDVKEHTSKWGEFTVEKSFEVTPHVSNNAASVNNLIHSIKHLSITPRISGFILQYVKKETTVYGLCKDNILQLIENIDVFTENRVKYMNDNYYELFPVVDGKCTEADSFQNGAVLRYVKDGKKWFADNNPPTKGEITQKGTCYFIPEKKSIVNNVVELIEKNKRKRSSIPITLLGKEWDMNPTLPANGLPYMKSDIEDIFIKLKKSNVLHHAVHVTWNGIQPKKNKNTKKNENTKKSERICEPLEETNNENNTRNANTQLKSSITHL